MFEFEGSGIVLTPLCPRLLDLMASVYTMCIPNFPQDIKYMYSVLGLIFDPIYISMWALKRVIIYLQPGLELSSYHTPV